jgi:exodeoxyribonuclease-3
MLRLVSWNINSIRVRVDNVRQLVAEWAPDVLCLQNQDSRRALST